MVPLSLFEAIHRFFSRKILTEYLRPSSKFLRHFRARASRHLPREFNTLSFASDVFYCVGTSLLFTKLF